MTEFYTYLFINKIIDWAFTGLQSQKTKSTNNELIYLHTNTMGRWSIQDRNCFQTETVLSEMKNKFISTEHALFTIRKKKKKRKRLCNRCNYVLLPHTNCLSYSECLHNVYMRNQINPMPREKQDNYDVLMLFFECFFSLLSLCIRNAFQWNEL